jgi:hypothetical protein
MRVVKVLCSVTVMIISLGMSFTNAYAISGSDFNAGHIMDDKVFFNSDSMSVSDIQSCLDSKLPPSMVGAHVRSMAPLAVTLHHILA